MPDCRHHKREESGIEIETSVSFFVIKLTQEDIMFQPMMHRYIPVGEEVFHLVGSLQLVDVTALHAVELCLSFFIVAIET